MDGNHAGLVTFGGYPPCQPTLTRTAVEQSKGSNTTSINKNLEGAEEVAQ